jgi:CheY-like chemotaxis protein
MIKKLHSINFVKSQNKSLFNEPSQNQNSGIYKDKSSNYLLVNYNDKLNLNVKNKMSYQPKDFRNILFCNCNDVLLCDDESFNLVSQKNLLKKLNVECDVCSNGKECINLILEKKNKSCCNKKYYKLIFLDLMMPVMDGIETAKNIQDLINKKIINENTKIFIISAHIEKNIIEKLKTYDVIKEFHSKPIKKNVILEILKKYYYQN